ncbi:unnamed protein product [Bursaphelenchus xylophilus]|uniref:(pine wood nematode) hypothetical protein n=1 Tax=Bursaphelenchus xylophilus TaxID=6326 RepID=A0A1I7S4B9_BURXY|nr:unnamed protein product [Bursaphelenchus xylophilus]CAG9116932.1 unnamed protein product [Bursaphelenchus xylophilus]
MFLKRLLKKRFRLSSEPDAESEPRTAHSTSYVEHKLGIHELKGIYKESFINAEQPEQSDGLSIAVARKRYDSDGPNIVDDAKAPKRWNFLLNKHFYNFWILLSGATVLNIIAYILERTDQKENNALTIATAVTLVLAVISMILLSFWQERRSINIVNTTKRFIGNYCFVVRDCDTRCVSTKELVVGDLLHINAGQRIPADARLILANDLFIDASIITGVKDKQHYTCDAVGDDVNPFEAKNIAFQGTYVTDGDGLGLVIRTGRNTFLGNTAEIQEHASRTSLLAKNIKEAVDNICIWALIMSVAAFVIGIVVNEFTNVLYYFIIGFLVVLVAAVPQGLPPAIMCHLAIIAKRLSLKHICIRNLDVIDELGAATVLFTGRAGILTENKLTVINLWYNQQVHHVPLTKSAIKEIRKKSSHQPPSLNLMHSVMGVCNRIFKFHELPSFAVRKAFIHTPETKFEDETVTIGRSVQFQADLVTIHNINDEYLDTRHTADFTVEMKRHGFNSTVDAAIYGYLKKANVSILELGQTYKPIFEIPFNANRKWQLIVAKCQRPVECKLFPLDCDDKDVYVVMMKGAPDEILKRCNEYTFEDQIRNISHDFIAECDATAEAFRLKGCPVISFAMKFFTSEKDVKPKNLEDLASQSNLTFIGMASLNDPPRNDTPAAISTCKQAGLKVYLITGEHPMSALALACQIGLVQSDIDNIKINFDDENFEVHYGDDWAVVRSGRLNQMSSKELGMIFERPYIIFSEITSAQTLFLVKECRKHGQVVALTGGAANDAPALAKANVGICSKEFSTDVARKTADIILEYDGLPAIIEAMGEGRTLFKNMQLAVAYTLAHLFPEVFPIILNFIIGLPLGLSPLQVLSIDLACELLPSIALAFEKPEEDVLKCPPRSPKQKMVSYSLMVYSYFCIGVIITLGCFVAYLTVYYHHGIPPDTLPFSRTDFWHGEAENLTSPLTGVVLYAEHQMEVLGQASAAYQMTLVIAQVFHIFTCTTKRTSVFQRMPSSALISTVFIEIAILFVLFYFQFTRELLGVSVPPLFSWIYGPAVGVVIVVFTEIRKYFIRNASKNEWYRKLEF